MRSAVTCAVRCTGYGAMCAVQSRLSTPWRAVCCVTDTGLFTVAIFSVGCDLSEYVAVFAVLMCFPPCFVLCGAAGTVIVLYRAVMAMDCGIRFGTTRF